jgi:hypothetical protein
MLSVNAGNDRYIAQDAYKAVPSSGFALTRCAVGAIVVAVGMLVGEHLIAVVVRG